VESHDFAAKIVERRIICGKDKQWWDFLIACSLNKKDQPSQAGPLRNGLISAPLPPIGA